MPVLPGLTPPQLRSFPLQQQQWQKISFLLWSRVEAKLMFIYPGCRDGKCELYRKLNLRKRRMGEGVTGERETCRRRSHYVQTSQCLPTHSCQARCGLGVRRKSSDSAKARGLSMCCCVSLWSQYGPWPAARHTGTAVIRYHCVKLSTFCRPKTFLLCFPILLVHLEEFQLQREKAQVV